MEMIDRAHEWRRLKELYRQKADGELAVLAAQGYQLTELAQEALKAEISSRRLDIKIETALPEPVEETEPVGPYEFDPENLELVPHARVWSMEEARATKAIYDNAGIPSYLGDENLECVDDYKGSFEGGVDLKVRQADSRRASAVRHKHALENGTEDQNPEEEDKYIPPRCPGCRSEEIVFESREPGLEGNAAFHAKFNWSCDACGHEWQDDGVVV